MQKFLTYILFSKSIDKYYIGYTSQTIQQRLHHHLSEHKGFTAKAKDWAIVYLKEFENKNDAIQEEKRLKALKNKIALQRIIQLRSSTG